MWFDLFTVRSFHTDMPPFTRNKLFSFNRKSTCPREEKMQTHTYTNGSSFLTKKNLCWFLYHFKCFLPRLVVHFSFWSTCSNYIGFRRKSATKRENYKLTTNPLTARHFSQENWTMTTMTHTYVSHDHLTCYRLSPLCEKKIIKKCSVSNECENKTHSYNCEICANQL